MKGWILYSKKKDELTDNDYGVRRLLEAGEEKGIDFEVYTPNQFELTVTRDDRRSVLIDDKVQSLPDFLIPRLGSSTSYFALAVIRQLEHLGVYSFNSASTVSLVGDKLQMHQLLAHSNLPSPRTMLLKFPVNSAIVAREVGFPTVVKDVNGTEGQGVYLSRTEDSFNDLMGLLEKRGNHHNIILQEFIESSSGKDVRVFVVGGRAIACMKRVSEKNFKANFSAGNKVEPFELSPKLEWLATETAKLAQLDIAGIDLLFDTQDDEFKICEANSSPGFKGLELATERNIAEQIIDYILIRMGQDS